MEPKTLLPLPWSRPNQLAVALILAAAAAFAVLPLIEALFGTTLAALMLWLAKSDLENFELPDLANLGVAALGSVWIATVGDAAPYLLQAALRAITSAACLSAIKWSYARLRGFDGLGWGDVKLAAAGAVWLDWPQLPIALLIAAAAGILVVVGRGALGRALVTTSTAIPFGAFLAPSIWLVWFAGRVDLF